MSRAQRARARGRNVRARARVPAQGGDELGVGVAVDHGRVADVARPVRVPDKHAHADTQLGLSAAISRHRIRAIGELRMLRARFAYLRDSDRVRCRFRLGCRELPQLTREIPLLTAIE